MKNLNKLLVLCLDLYAEEKIECEKIVELVISLFNKNKVIENWNCFAEDFMIAGYKGDVAKSILVQILAQAGTITKYEKKSQTKENEKSILTYTIEYSNVGQKIATFKFDKNNLICEIELMKVMVKESAKIEYNDEKAIEVPLILDGKIPLVKVSVNEKPCLFLLDTGAGVSLLNQAYFKGEQDKTESNLKDVTGNISNVNMVVIKDFDFAGIRMHNQKMLTLDLFHIEQVNKNKINGILGYDILKNYDLYFDYAKNHLVLLQPDYTSSFIKENKLKKMSKFSYKMANNIPVIEGVIAGKSFNFGLDTGSEAILLSDSLFFTFERYFKETGEDELRGADTNRKIMIKTGEIEKIKLGNKTFKNVTVHFSDISHLNQSLDITIDGILGYPFLFMQAILISYKNKEIVLFK